MKILITGSSGRVGRAIHVRLSPQHEVMGLDRAPSSTSEWVGDLGDAALLRRALAGVEVLIHTAALHAPHVGVVPDREFQRINVEGTRRLLDEAAAAGVRRIVLTSTTALYGAAATAAHAAVWVDESTPPLPQTIYHHSKLAAEALLREAALSSGPGVRILRMSRCFPEPAPVMAVYRLHRGVDARDVAEAHALAINDAGPAHATYVISGATPFQRDDAGQLLNDAAAVLRERTPELVAAFAQRGWLLPSSIDRVYDPRRAGIELGWRPRYGFEAVLSMWDQNWSEVLPPNAARSPVTE